MRVPVASRFPVPSGISRSCVWSRKWAFDGAWIVSRSTLRPDIVCDRLGPTRMSISVPSPSSASSAPRMVVNWNSASCSVATETYSPTVGSNAPNVAAGELTNLLLRSSQPKANESPRNPNGPNDPISCGFEIHVIRTPTAGFTLRRAAKLLLHGVLPLMDSSVPRGRVAIAFGSSAISIDPRRVS